MAASVNNIAATFSSARTSSSSPFSALCNNNSSSSSSSSCCSASACVSWNPQVRANAFLRTSFIGLYGGPGPKRRAVTSRKAVDLQAHLPPSPSPPGVPPLRASISVGEKLPEAELSYFDKEGELRTVRVSELTRGKKVVFFAVPGAFTPTCSQQHLPGFIEKADELRAKGVDAIACIAVNDAFVMKAWGEGLGVEDKVLLLSDGNGHFTKALGVSLDLSDRPQGLGVRSRRYALLAEDGIVTLFNLEEGGAFTISSAEDILNALTQFNLHHHEATVSSPLMLFMNNHQKNRHATVAPWGIWC
ncbi:hypothetical protein O6H91_07G070200 [Diphasiastrum complanatum]|uniref:Uncharacterized protein n=4 Tax=Diphasiastrum complanatum TaxID=34168 RepID=A0ACC2D6E5_DIPCM|nr:hypothetical protein O6H91_07G070200 [Diphasiastrum complanatum]